MTDVNAKLTVVGITSALKTSGVTVAVHREIDSTNTEAKRLANRGLVTSPTLVVAESQTAGRGRSGHSFFSPESSGLYMTLALPSSERPTDVAVLTTMTAVAVLESLEKFTDGDYRIKWVNDIFRLTDDGARKVCGILAELVTDPTTLAIRSVIIGIGINVTTAQFPSEIADIAASIGALVDRNQLCADIADRVMACAENLADRSYMKTYRSKSLVLGRTVTFVNADGDVREGIAESIGDDGELVVVHADGERSVLTFGEISIKMK